MIPRPLSMCLPTSPAPFRCAGRRMRQGTVSHTIPLILWRILPERLTAQPSTAKEPKRTMCKLSERNGAIRSAERKTHASVLCELERTEKHFKDRYTPFNPKGFGPQPPKKSLEGAIRSYMLWFTSSTKKLTEMFKYIWDK